MGEDGGGRRREGGGRKEEGGGGGGGGGGMGGGGHGTIALSYQEVGSDAQRSGSRDGLNRDVLMGRRKNASFSCHPHSVVVM